MDEEQTIRGEISVTIVPVTDMTRAVKFYQDVLGLPLKFEGPDWSEFNTRGAVLALQKAKEQVRPQREEEARFTIDVEDLDAQAERLTERGIEFVVPPHPEDYGRMAIFHDSEGNGIELVERKQD